MKYQGLTSLLAVALLAACGHAPQLNQGNVDDVLSHMKTEEKINMVIGAGNEKFLGYGSTKLIVPGAAGTTAPIKRLGVSPTVLSDGPAGIRIDTVRPNDAHRYYHTGFPIGTALAATWNQSLVKEVGNTIGKEAHAYGLDLLFAPGMNLHRDPLGGRNFEYYSEDPLLSGKTAAAFVTGVQQNGVGACPKHYAVNNQETNRKDVDETVAERPLHELYLRGFEIAVREAKPWAVMSAYNAVNGEQCMESRMLLTDVLRGRWGFDGIVVTDWAAPGWRNTAKELHAGNDLMAPGSEAQRQEIRDALRDGSLQMADLDTCTRRMLRFVARTSRQQGYQATNAVDLKADAQVSRQAAEEAMVLLQNKQKTLPLPAAEVKQVGLFGISSFNFISVGTGSGNVKSRHTVNLLEGLSHAGLRVNKAVASRYQQVISDSIARRTYDELGYFAIPEIAPDSLEVLRSAADDDLAIITIGRSSGEGVDRNLYTDFLLQPNERQLLRQVSRAFHAKGKRVVVILNVPGVVETVSWRDQVDAILCAWLPGQEGGDAVVDLLTGKVNPSGRLPMTWCRAYEDCNTRDNFPYDYHGPRAIGNYKKIPRTPAIKNVHYIDYAEGIYVGYRYFDTFDKPVAYPFGFGLSYTQFDYNNARVERLSGGNYVLRVEVTNVSDVAGKEVVQAYAPVKDLKHQLIAYAKTRLLKPGETQLVELHFTNRDLSWYDSSVHDWALDAGNRPITVGSNSRDERCQAAIEVTE